MGYSIGETIIPEQPGYSIEETIMPEQPNHCTGCGKLMADTNAAYYCSKACMEKVLGKAKRITQKFFCKRPKVTHD